ncbi:hypothetical protein IHE44_0002678 [Lamprotornis superbus]|uniref:Uncharacterized protein n=1 Tax=Lamprotornis superbus TaxID=245042 RepID=A0A835U0W9_9PASS|nr:hypothetical protein IHE44_0002678 [Lamprotornis superbus]
MSRLVLEEQLEKLLTRSLATAIIVRHLLMLAMRMMVSGLHTTRFSTIHATYTCSYFASMEKGGGDPNNPELDFLKLMKMFLRTDTHFVKLLNGTWKRNKT